MSLKSNITANYLGRAYSLVALYMFVPFYISILGVEGYGLVALYTVLLSLAALADVGLSAAFSREAARAREKRELLDLLTTIEGTLMLTTAVVAIGIFVAADWITIHWLNVDTVPIEEAVSCIRIMALTFPFQIVIGLYVGGLLGLQRQGLANLVLVFHTTLRSGAVILVIMLKPDVTTFFAWQLGSVIFSFLLARSVLMRALGHNPLVLGRYSPATMQSVLRFAGGMMVITLLSALNTQTDKLVVSKLFTMEEFGYYALASALAQIPYIITAPILVALLPKWTYMVTAKQSIEIGSLYEAYSYRIALISSLAAFGLIFFAADILDIWLQHNSLDPKWGLIVSILSAGGLLLSLAALPFYFGLAHGHYSTSILLSTVTLFVTTPLLLLAATSHLGLVGAALPWVALNAITFAVLAIAVHGRYFQGNGRRWITKSIVLPVLLGALFMFCGRLLSDALHLQSFAACITAAVCGCIAILLAFHRGFTVRPI